MTKKNVATINPATAPKTPPSYFSGELPYSSVLSTRDEALLFINRTYPYNYSKLEERLVDPQEVLAHENLTFRLLPGEIWVTIPIAPGYAISNLGRFFLCMKDDVWYPVQLSEEEENKKHYLYSMVTLPGTNKKKKLRINRIVADAFCRCFFDYTIFDKMEHFRAAKKHGRDYSSDPDTWGRTLIEAHHRDRDPKNNVPGNLEILPQSVHDRLEEVVEYALLTTGPVIKFHTLDELTHWIGGRNSITALSLQVAEARDRVRARLKDDPQADMTEVIHLHITEPGALNLGQVNGKPVSMHHKYPLRITFDFNRPPVQDRPAEVVVPSYYRVAQAITRERKAKEKAEQKKARKEAKAMKKASEKERQ